MTPSQTGLPVHRASPLLTLNPLFQRQNSSNEEIQLWYASLSSYAFFWEHYFSKKIDPSMVVGQDNLLLYQPQSIILRIRPEDRPINILQACAAAVVCGAHLTVSAPKNISRIILIKKLTPPTVQMIVETDEEFLARVAKQPFPRIRFLSSPQEEVCSQLLKEGARIICAPILANGRLELLHYTREISLSIDYHRYGNLGVREGEARTPLKDVLTNKKELCCVCECG